MFKEFSVHLDVILTKDLYLQLLTVWIASFLIFLHFLSLEKTKLSHSAVIHYLQIFLRKRIVKLLTFMLTYLLALSLFLSCLGHYIFEIFMNVAFLSYIRYSFAADILYHLPWCSWVTAVVVVLYIHQLEQGMPGKSLLCLLSSSLFL